MYITPAYCGFIAPDITSILYIFVHPVHETINDFVTLALVYF